jgi:hypothetical protein
MIAGTIDMFTLLLWLAWCGLLGACFVSLFWPRRIMPVQPSLWLGAMSVTAGLAFSSIGHLLWLATGNTHDYLAGQVGGGAGGPGPWAADAAIACVLMPAGAVSWYMRRKRREANGSAPAVTLDAVDEPGLPWWRWASAASVLAMLAGAAARILEAPHGEFDAVSIWNARARFFFRAPEHWRGAFATAVHADYPLMLPLNTARAWWVLGHETLLAPAMLALLYALITLAAVWGATRLLVGAARASLAVLLLTAVPLLAVQASFEYADVPVACCVASAAGLAMVSLRLRTAGPPGSPGSPGSPGHPGRDAASSSEALGLIALCGLCCGCAAWLKNEGQLITLCAAAATALVHPGPIAGSFGGRLKRLIAFVAGAAPPMIVVLAVRKSIGHPSDLLGDRSLTDILTLALDPARHGRIFSEFFIRVVADLSDEQLLQSPAGIAGTTAVNSIGLLLVIAVVVLTWPSKRTPGFLTPASCWVVVFVALVASGYYLVYLFTPFDLPWHVKFSVTRLFMHVWPALVLMAATAGPMIEKREASNRVL